MANNVGNFQDSGTLLPVTTQKVSGAVNNGTSVTLTASNSNIAVGQVVTGSGIANADGINPATTVTATGNPITLSRPATLVDGVTLNFSSYQNQNIETDFVWGNFAIQPNDDRATTAAGNFPASGVTTAKITTASTDAKVTTFTTDVAHNLVVGSTVNTGVFATGGTVASPVAGTTVLSESVNAIATATAASVTANVAANTNVTIPSTANLVVGMVVTASGGTVTTLAAGTTITLVTSNTVIQLSSAINVSGTTLTFAYTPAVADSTQKTVTINTPTNKFVVGQVVSISGGTSGNNNAIYNGSFTVLARTANSITIANANTPTEIKDTLAIAATPFDLNNATVLSVPSTTTFTVASGPVSSSSSASTVTASLEVVGDTNWAYLNGVAQTAATTKVQSARLAVSKLTDSASKDRFVISNTVNGNSLETPIDSALLADSGFYGFPNFNTGKYPVTAAQAGGSAANPFVLVTASNNFAETLTLGTSTVNLTGFTNPAFNINGAIVRAATADNFVVSGSVTTQVGGNGSTSQVGVTLTAANNAIQVGQSVVISGSVVGKVAAISGTALTLDTATSVANSTTITFLAPLGTALTGQSAAAQIAGWGIGNFNVTAVTVDATTNTTYKYTAQNNLNAGDVVTVTGLVSNAILNPNVSSVTVAAATATSFTVTGRTASTAGYSITGQTGKVEYSSALTNVDGAFATGTFGYLVPSVVGKTSTVAIDALNDRGFVHSAGSTTSSASNVASVTGITRTAGSNLAVLTGGAGAFTNLVAGDVVTVSSSSILGLVNSTDYTVAHWISATAIVINTGTTDAVSSGTLTLTPKIGTVHSQQYAAGTARTTTAITTGLWAA